MAVKKVVETETETAAVAAEEVKEAAPKKTTRKTTAAKKEAAPKKTAASKKAAETTEEAAPKKTTTRKTAAKKAAAPEVTVFVEYAGKQVVAKEVLAAAIESYKAANADTEIKTIEVYMKPEENVAYYVVNGVGSDAFKVEL